MTDQLSLFGHAPPAARNDRLFFGLFPPPGAAKLIGELGRVVTTDLGLRGRLHREDRLHITVHHVDDYAGLPPDVVASCQQAGALVRIAPFRCVFDSIASFKGKPGKYPLILRGSEGVDGLQCLREVLGKVMMTAGLRPPAPFGFVPHITLTYADRMIEARVIQPVGWTVGELVLVHSHVGRSHYEILGRWPLQP